MSDCITHADTVVYVDYHVVWDSEPDWDQSFLEYTACTDPLDPDTESWVPEASINGGAGVYDGWGSAFETISIAAPPSFRLRFHFTSDGAWSDQDGLWDTDGAIIVDSITVSNNGGVLVATETFEDEANGAQVANDWEACTPPGYGDFAMMVAARPTTYQNDPVEEDPCNENFTCLWIFVNGSTVDYACNTPNPSPQQLAVPYENQRGQYIHNAIWSPWIPFTGTGAITDLTFDVYRDLALDPLIFYEWGIRSLVAGCPGSWQDRGFVYYGGAKDWLRPLQPVGDLVEVGATHVQIALNVYDVCPYVCGAWGTGQCHSHAPMFDNAELYRVAVSGPQFSGRDIDMFHDTFPTDGTTTGTCRADMTQDILPLESAGILHGDSAKVVLTDPEVGLPQDAYTGCSIAAYCYISTDQNTYGTIQKQATDTRDMGPPCGVQLRWPYVNTVNAAGRSWHMYRMDTCFTQNGSAVEDTYCIDFNDNLFVPGDTCWFFFGAVNTIGTWSYWNAAYGNTPSVGLCAANPDEFTMLPAVGRPVEDGGRGGDILYCDGMNFRGAQPYFDTAFQANGIFDLVDRYDIRGPSSGVSNRPGSRAVVAQILPPIYRKIIYNAGDLSEPAIGDGGAEHDDKSPDCQLFADWLNQMEQDGGLWLNGDDLPSGMLSAGCAQLRAWINYSLTSTNHVANGAGVNPAVMDALGVPPAEMCFDTLTQFIAYAGCPLINDFDVIEGSPTLSYTQLNYHRDIPPPQAAPNGGSTVVQHSVNGVGRNVTVVLEGYSFHYIRNYPGVAYMGGMARYEHMNDVIECLSNVLDDPIAVRPNARTNSLAQNYPNPFNPTTTIKYTIKEQAHVSLKIYNVAGQLVKTLVNDVQKPDAVKPVEWHGLNNAGQRVSSGVYFYKLVTKDFTQTKKMVLLK
jgi:hypothetical protein